MGYVNVRTGSSSTSSGTRTRRPVCQRCGGALANDYDDMCCVNCGATYDEHGHILAHMAFKYEQPRALETVGE